LDSSSSVPAEPSNTQISGEAPLAPRFVRLHCWPARSPQLPNGAVYTAITIDAKTDRRVSSGGSDRVQIDGGATGTRIDSTAAMDWRSQHVDDPLRRLPFERFNECPTDLCRRSLSPRIIVIRIVACPWRQVIARSWKDADEEKQKAKVRRAGASHPQRRP
jgi:hypothetical protein